MKHILLFLLFALPLLATAQDDYYKKKPADRSYIITLKDGTQLRGEIVRQDSIEAIIRTRDLGEVRVDAGQIVRTEQRGAETPEGTFPNIFPQTMRLAPTAFSAEKGRGYYRNYLLYFNQFEYGISDNWSVGTSFFLLRPWGLFSLNTKFTLPVSNRVRLGLNAQYVVLQNGGFLRGNNAGYEGVGYIQGLATLGDRQNNSTVGLGWSLSNGSVSRNVVGSFGLVRKISPKLSFITENFILFGDGSISFSSLLSAGVRFDRRKHAFDLAAYVPIVSYRAGGIRETSAVFIPFGSYYLRLGK